MSRTRTRLAGVSLTALTCVLVLSASASAQQTSAIAGLARDTSGGVLPGVTVEAASPALIEKVRTAVTDGEGRYNIVDLRPGTYTVTFTLAGFSTFRREGIVLTAGFTAAVNADMQVGALEETITVTGDAPLVDTQNVRQQTVVSRALLDTLPTSTKNWSTLATLTTGFSGTADIAGQLDQSVGRIFHGRSGTRVQYDGMGVMNMVGSGGNEGYIIQTHGVQEMTVQTSGLSAESSAAGALVNMIPREGSNTFSGTAFGLWTNDGLEGDNLTDALRARGLTAVNKILEIYDATVTMGGPIKKDKVWFFTAQREWGNRHLMAGFYWNKTQGTPFYTPDLSRPADRYQWYESHLGRVTWQASQKDKLNFFADRQTTCQCRSSGAIGNAPEVGTAFHFRPQGLYQASWSEPRTSRLLLEAAASVTISHWPQYLAPGVQHDDISYLEQSTNIRFNAPATFSDRRDSDRLSQRFSVSYVTGSHAFKTGFQTEQGIRNTRTSVAHDVNYTFNRGVPVQMTQYATPYLMKERFLDLGIYGQDQWTVRRLTLNYGVRFEQVNGWVPPQHVPAGQFLPERSFARVSEVPNWKDVSPRLGAAYDLFGNGRTALKFSLGRYLGRASPDIAGANNPIFTSVNSVNRTWNDANGNYLADCDLRNFAANGECGTVSNQSFGQLNIRTRYADEAIHGWGARDYNWDMSTEVQHQLGPGMSVSGGYYRSWYGNFLVTDNLEVTPADFDPFCIPAPKDSRLPDGGGSQVCGLYDVSLAKFGRVNNLVTHASHFGAQQLVNDFFNLSVNARLGSGTQLGVGVDTGRTVNDRCVVVDSPQDLLNCRVVTPFKGNTQVKANGSLLLPGDVIVSGVLQNIAGINYLASYAASNAEIGPSLGRNLAACGTRTPCTATVANIPLIAPQTQFEDRLMRLDLRVTKVVRITQRLRLQANVDGYNVLNGSAVKRTTDAYGSRWRLPTDILEARIFQFSGQLSF